MKRASSGMASLPTGWEAYLGRNSSGRDRPKSHWPLGILNNQLDPFTRAMITAWSQDPPVRSERDRILANNSISVQAWRTGNTSPLPSLPVLLAVCPLDRVSLDYASRLACVGITRRRRKESRETASYRFRSPPSLGRAGAHRQESPPPPRLSPR